MKKRTLITAGLIVAAFGLAGCSASAPAENQAKPTATGIEQSTADIKQLVANIGTGTVAAKSASITSTKLTVKGEDGKTTDYDLGEDEFFLSIAPYVNQTHPCATHSLTGCEGEMKEQKFNVTIRESNGNAIMEDAVMTSQANGFIDIWLPRDRTYQVTVSHEGKVAEAGISTFDSDDTCVATMQLS